MTGVAAPAAAAGAKGGRGLHLTRSGEASPNSSARNDTSTPAQGLESSTSYQRSGLGGSITQDVNVTLQEGTSAGEESGETPASSKRRPSHHESAVSRFSHAAHDAGASLSHKVHGVHEAAHDAREILSHKVHEVQEHRRSSHPVEFEVRAPWPSGRADLGSLGPGLGNGAGALCDAYAHPLGLHACSAGLAGADRDHVDRACRKFQGGGKEYQVAAQVRPAPN